MEDKHIEARKRFSNIQSQLIAPKNQKNNFGKYNYRSCEDILEALKPLLPSNNMTLTISDEIKEIGGRIYVIATSTIKDCLSDWGESATGYARESETKKGMDDSQITGSTSSYARKYSLNGLFCIDDTKDSDATNKHGKEEDRTNKKNEYYPDADFQKNKAQWIALVLENKTTVMKIIEKVSNGGKPLNKAQIKELHDSLVGL